MTEQTWRCPDTLAELAVKRRVRALLSLAVGTLLGGCLAWAASRF